MSRISNPREIEPWEMSHGYPDVSIIVLNYRRANDTINCLGSLSEIEYEGCVEIIVVENGSGDDSAALINRAIQTLPLKVRVILNRENKGFAGGVLSAWSCVRTPMVCLLNNDATVHPDFLSQLVDHYRGRQHIGAVWPYDAPAEWYEAKQRMSSAQIADSRNGTNGLLGQPIWLPILPTPHDCFTGSGVCLLTSYALNTKPFPCEYFAYYEDVYLGWLINLRGLRVERVPEATIYHRGSQTGASNEQLRPLLAFHAEKNRLANLLIFYSPSTLLRILPLLVLDEIKKAAVFLLKLLRRQSGLSYLLCNLRARVWLLTHLPWLVAERKWVQAQRRTSDAEILSLISGRFIGSDDGFRSYVNGLNLLYCKVLALPILEFSIKQEG